MSRKHQFIKSLITILKHNRDGSFRTQNDRREILMHTVKVLYESGYQLEHVKYIKQRHIRFLVTNWQACQISAGTMKNRMSHIRWLMEKLGKSQIVPSNDALSIPKRTYISQVDKSRDLNENQLAKIANPYMKLSLQGQKLFGLRQEESLKLCPFQADQGDVLRLKGSWTKGGRERTIPIRTQAQRDWLEACKSLVHYKHNSLIPADKTYKQHREAFKKMCQRAGIHKRHGLRHRYAQQRYAELTGFPCSVKGGSKRQSMTTEQKALDNHARLTISHELGHSRVGGIVSQYCGC